MRNEDFEAARDEAIERKVSELMGDREYVMDLVCDLIESASAVELLVDIATGLVPRDRWESFVRDEVWSRAEELCDAEAQASAEMEIVRSEDNE